MKALLNREIQIIKTVFDIKIDFLSTVMILVSSIFCLFLNISLFSLIFTGFSILTIVNLIEESSIKKGILSMACTRKQYVKFRFLFYITSLLIAFFTSIILQDIFSMIVRSAHISLKCELIIFFIVLFVLAINLTIFFLTRENIFVTISMITIGLIISINIFSSIARTELLKKISLAIKFNLINNWMYFLAILIVSITVICISMIISIYFFEKKDL